MSANVPKVINIVIERALVKYSFVPAFNSTLRERIYSKKKIINHILLRNKDRSKYPLNVSH